MEIFGYCKEIKFRNEKTGNTTFLLSTNAFPKYRKGGFLMCVANMPSYQSNTPLLLVGDINRDTNIFEATLVKPHLTNKETACSYISSGIVKGIGEKLAQKIVNVTGPDLFTYIQKRNPRNELLKTLTEKEMSLFDEFVWKTRILLQQNDVYTYISQFGGDYLAASKICENRTNALHSLKTNPYLVGLNAGLKFDVCDLIYNHEGGNCYDECRIEALVIKSLEQNENCGNTFAYIHNIMKWVNMCSRQSSVFKDIIPEALVIRSCFNSRKIICEKTTEKDKGIVFRYFLKDTYLMEKDIVKNINRIKNGMHSLPFNPKWIEKIEKINNVKYSNRQKDAFNFLNSTGIKVLTGGPGTGKTTVINGLIQAYTFMFPQNPILLCAPTGRAAQRISEATGKPAFTLHKALDVHPFGEEMQAKTLDNPLDANLIIVDEMSMTDTEIFSLLLGAVKTDTLVILCGDTDQLPSVGAGNILHDIIECGIIETNKLDVVYRQAAESGITQNAISVNNGSTSLTKKDDFDISVVKNHLDISNKICEIVKDCYDVRNPFSVQVLSSTKKGDAGTIALNKKLQQICNPQKEESELDYTFKRGDKIMMFRNNYEIGYVNGDTGTILEITPNEIIVDIKGTGKLSIPKTNMSDISLAYSVTIHKSQGSEFDTVIISLPNSPISILKRNLLYTAITRAKKKVIIVTQTGVIEHTINTLDTELRQTDILDKLIPVPKTIF